MFFTNAEIGAGGGVSGIAEWMRERSAVAGSSDFMAIYSSECYRGDPWTLLTIIAVRLDVMMMQHHALPLLPQTCNFDSTAHTPDKTRTHAHIPAEVLVRNLVRRAKEVIEHGLERIGEEGCAPIERSLQHDLHLVTSRHLALLVRSIKNSD